jgi:hypothetical protein
LRSAALGPTHRHGERGKRPRCAPRVRLVQSDAASAPREASGERRGGGWGGALREAVVGCGRSAVPGARQPALIKPALPAAVGLALLNGAGRARRAVRAAAAKG